VWGPTPVPEMRRRFVQGRTNPEYAAAVRGSEVIGVWDDHDFGRNNGGHAWEHKETVKEMFLEFLGEPRDSPRRARAGMYESSLWGPPGRRVKVILLDVRYFFDPQAASHQILGREQWAWLEAQLRGGAEGGWDFTVLVSGVQMVALGNPFAEHWGLFPSERDRLFDLIEATRAPGVVLVSGDVHYAVASVARCTSQMRSARGESRGVPGYPLYEITSSGLTHAWEEDLAWLGMPLFRWAFGNIVPPFQRIAPSAIYARRNYGTLSFDWDGDGDAASANGPAIVARIHGVDGAAVIERRITRVELTPSAVHAADYAACEAVSAGLIEHAWRSYRVFATVAVALLSALVSLAFAVRWCFCCCSPRGGGAPRPPKAKRE
jgi:alkaline phosphatase D